MKFYEVVFIVKQDASANHVESITHDLKNVIKEYGGEVTKTEFCGLRNLAYPINKCKKGHYVLLNVIMDKTEGIEELERMIRINEDIIRHLVVRVDKLNNEPSALMRRHGGAAHE